jgi:hypothetical protein
LKEGREKNRKNEGRKGKDRKGQENERKDSKNLFPPLSLTKENTA